MKNSFHSEPTLHPRRRLRCRSFSSGWVDWATLGFRVADNPLNDDPFHHLLPRYRKVLELLTGLFVVLEKRIPGNARGGRFITILQRVEVIIIFLPMIESFISVLARVECVINALPRDECVITILLRVWSVISVPLSFECVILAVKFTVLLLAGTTVLLGAKNTLLISTKVTLVGETTFLLVAELICLLVLEVSSLLEAEMEVPSLLFWRMLGWSLLMVKSVGT